MCRRRRRRLVQCASAEGADASKVPAPEAPASRMSYRDGAEVRFACCAPAVVSPVSRLPSPRCLRSCACSCPLPPSGAAGAPRGSAQADTAVIARQTTSEFTQAYVSGTGSTYLRCVADSPDSFGGLWPTKRLRSTGDSPAAARAVINPRRRQYGEKGRGGRLAATARRRRRSDRCRRRMRRPSGKEVKTGPAPGRPRRRNCRWGCLPASVEQSWRVAPRREERGGAGEAGEGAISAAALFAMAIAEVSLLLRPLRFLEKLSPPFYY